jgi:hypothetical protein
LRLLVPQGFAALEDTVFDVSNPISLWGAFVKRIALHGPRTAAKATLSAIKFRRKYVKTSLSS